jgi:predicted metalloprotease with PDZ domain
MRIRYSIRAAEPTEHRGRFSLDLDGTDGPSLDLVLPSWVPGAYRIINSVRGFRDLTARRVPEGTSLPVRRVERNRWRVETQGARGVHVEYTVYGHDLVDDGFDLNEEHLFVNAAVCLPYVDGHLTEPAEVSLEIPPDWTVVTELEEVGRHPPCYRAPDYDVLVDNPIDAGHPLVVTIHPSGIPHRISLCGPGGNYELHRLEEDLGKIVEATVRLLGDSPLRSYTFFYHLAEVPDGGLEHASSTSCVIRRTAFQPLNDYQRFLGLTSHEYFHLYNVKRIRPKVLGPFDYTRENYTRLLWWMEGTTDYFTDLVLRRAGLLTPERYLQEKAKQIQKYLETPGRRHQTLEDSSWLAWVDYYQPFEETPNQSISYYLKGNLVSLCLDLEIRHRTENRASLETVLRTLWTEYGKANRGLEEDELASVVSRSTGLDIGPFFAKYVQGTDEIDFDQFARFAGLTFGPKPKRRDVEEDPTEPGYLGVRYENSGGLVRVRHVLTDTPGRRAGLTPGDEIVAINNVKVTHEGFENALKRYPPGTPVDLAVFRRGFLTRLSLTMGKPPPERYAFTPVDSPTELAKGVYEHWVGAKWESRSTSP